MSEANTTGTAAHGQGSEPDSGSNNDGNSASGASRPANLRQELKSYQIFFIVLSGTIGTSIFNTAGEALKLAGPMGLVVGNLIMGLIAVCVGETVSEMVQVFPVPNAIFAYVGAFIDEDLAWMVGLLYWYSWGSIFGEEMLNAAKLLGYWSPAPVWPPFVCYFLIPVILLLLNLFPVYIYGWIETVGGVLKTILAFFVSCVMFNIARINNAGGPGGSINDGFQANLQYSSTSLRAFCYAIPIIVLGFLGVESTVIAAFEAKTTKDIAWPSLWVHWIIWLLYVLVALGMALSVSWTNNKLPPIVGAPPEQARRTRGIDTTLGPPYTTSATILAIYAWSPALAGFVNGCLIFSVISAGNSALYYSSRTLYGLTYRLEGNNMWSRPLKGLSAVMERSGSPARAVLFSMLFFFWLPYLQLGNSFAIDDLIEVVSLTSSVSCVIVWAALLLAYWRYKTWTALCADRLRDRGFGRYVSSSREYERMARNYALTFQPAIAIVGLIGCILTFVFSSAMWWDTPLSARKFLSAFGAHIVALASVVIIKAWRGRLLRKWWVTLDPTAEELIRTIRRLEFLSFKSANRESTQTLNVEPGNSRTYSGPRYEMNGGIGG